MGIDTDNRLQNRFTTLNEEWTKQNIVLRFIGHMQEVEILQSFKCDAVFLYNSVVQLVQWLKDSPSSVSTSN